jgi:hypothetical protein
MSPPERDQRRAAAATRYAASSRGWGCAARPGSDVTTTHLVSLAGSAQQSVPVEPVWPKVCPEHPGLPDSLPTPNPNPRDVSPARLWFLIISSPRGTAKRGEVFATAKALPRNVRRRITLAPLQAVNNLTRTLAAVGSGLPGTRPIPDSPNTTRSRAITKADSLGFSLHPHRGCGILTVWHSQRGRSNSVLNKTSTVYHLTRGPREV